MAPALADLMLHQQILLCTDLVEGLLGKRFALCCLHGYRYLDDTSRVAAEILKLIFKLILYSVCSCGNFEIGL